jgi:shikimate dehydrogenase
VRHSASPALQNAGIAALGLDWRYVAFAVRPAELATALAGAAAMRFVGVNLTVPHKLLAVELVDELDVSAREWGAVNTVRFETRDNDGHWLPLAALEDIPPDARVRSQGFNTDADAITRSLAEDLGLELRGTRVVLLGAGGAGRTAALKLASEGVAHLSLVNRTANKAENLGREIAQRFPSVRVEVGYPRANADLLLNATSLGLKPDDASPLDETLFPIQRAAAVYDMIYRPAETPLLARARAAGCRTANGLGMLLHQGARALELWSGQPAPLEPMRRALRENVYGAPDESRPSAGASRPLEVRPT